MSYCQFLLQSANLKYYVSVKVVELQMLSLKIRKEIIRDTFKLILEFVGRNWENPQRYRNSNLERLEHDISCIWSCVNLLSNEQAATTDLSVREGATTAMMSMVKWCGKWNRIRVHIPVTPAQHYFHIGWPQRNMCYPNTADISTLAIQNFTFKICVKMVPLFISSKILHRDPTISINSISRPSDLTLEAGIRIKK